MDLRLGDSAHQRWIYFVVCRDLCVCVCVRERERVQERERVCVCARERDGDREKECVASCGCVCVSAHQRWLYLWGFYRNVDPVRWDCGKTPILSSVYLTGSHRIVPKQ